MVYERDGFKGEYLAALNSIISEYNGSFFVLQLEQGAFAEIDSFISSILRIWDRENDSYVIDKLSAHYDKEEIIKALEELRPFFSYKSDFKQKERALLRQKLNNLWLFMTNHCNFACQYCFHEEESKAYVKQNMKLETALGALSYFFSQPLEDEVVIHFFGGEPLLNFELIKRLVPYVKDMAGKAGVKALLTVSTNGSLVTDEMAAFFKEHDFFVAISIDGGEYQHNIHRKLQNGAGSFTEVEQGVRILKQYFPNLIGRITVTRQNVQYLSEMYKELYKLGFVDVAHKFVGACTTEHRVELDSLEEYKRQFAAIMDEQFASLTGGEFKVVDRAVGWVEKIHNKPLFSECSFALNNKLVVDCEGTFYRCEETVGSSAFAIGDITEGIVKFGRKAQAPPLMHNHKVCSSCLINGYCDGYCFYACYSAFGDFDNTIAEYCEESRFSFFESLYFYQRLYCFDEKLAEAYSSGSLGRIKSVLAGLERKNNQRAQIERSANLRYEEIIK